MSQGSFFDSVQDQLFDAPAVSRAPSAPVGPSLAEQSAAAQEVHDLWADRLGARTTRGGSPMSQAAIKATVHAGDVFNVTNHYITREDHPCFGTRRRTVVRTSAKNVTWQQDDGDHSVPWRRVELLADGSIRVYGHPTPDALFLTLRRVVSDER